MKINYLFLHHYQSVLSPYLRKFGDRFVSGIGFGCGMGAALTFQKRLSTRMD